MASVQRTEAPPAPPEAPPLVFRLPGGPEAPLNARRLVERLARHVPEKVRGSVMLMLSDVVANAVLHGAGRQELTIELVESGEHLRFVVCETGPEPAHPQGRRDEREGGPRLVILDRLAERWGMVRGCSGMCVWFDVRRA